GAFPKQSRYGYSMASNRVVEFKGLVMKMFDLTGKVALVTGGTSGIGLGMARGLLAAGASVALVGRNAQKGEKALAELKAGDRAIFLPADVSDPVRCRALAAEVEQHFGGLDILINNAGTNIGK